MSKISPASSSVVIQLLPPAPRPSKDSSSVSHLPTQARTFHTNGDKLVGRLTVEVRLPSDYKPEGSVLKEGRLRVEGSISISSFWEAQPAVTSKAGPTAQIGPKETKVLSHWETFLTVVRGSGKRTFSSSWDFEFAIPPAHAPYDPTLSTSRKGKSKAPPRAETEAGVALSGPSTFNDPFLSIEHLVLGSVLLSYSAPKHRKVLGFGVTSARIVQVREEVRRYYDFRIDPGSVVLPKDLHRKVSLTEIKQRKKILAETTVDIPFPHQLAQNPRAPPGKFVCQFSRPLLDQLGDGDAGFDSPPLSTMVGALSLTMTMIYVHPLASAGKGFLRSLTLKTKRKGKEDENIRQGMTADRFLLERIEGSYRIQTAGQWVEIPLDPLPLNIYSDDPRLTSDGLGIEAQLQHRHSRSLEAQGIDTGTFYTRAGSRTFHLSLGIICSDSSVVPFTPSPFTIVMPDDLELIFLAPLQPTFPKGGDGLVQLPFAPDKVSKPNGMESSLPRLLSPPAYSPKPLP